MPNCTKLSGKYSIRIVEREPENQVLAMLAYAEATHAFNEAMLHCHQVLRKGVYPNCPLVVISFEGHFRAIPQGIVWARPEHASAYTNDDAVKLVIRPLNCRLTAETAIQHSKHLELTLIPNDEYAVGDEIKALSEAFISITSFGTTYFAWSEFSQPKKIVGHVKVALAASSQISNGSPFLFFFDATAVHNTILYSKGGEKI